MLLYFGLDITEMESPVDIQVKKISNFNFPVLRAGQGHTDGLHFLLTAVHSVLELNNIEIFVSAQHLQEIIFHFHFKLSSYFSPLSCHGQTADRNPRSSPQAPPPPSPPWQVWTGSA